MESRTDSNRFWRSLDELAASPEFEIRLWEEFPRHASAFESEPDRRHFLKLMGASLALAGMSGCSRPPAEPIMPYVRMQPEAKPAAAMHFATAMPGPHGAMGLVVTSHQGRPTKIEGNTLHPASLGATDTFAQASILDLYDPDRSQTVRRRGQIATWEALLVAVRDYLESDPQGAGLRILSGPVNSPTLERQRAQLAQKYPSARWHEYEPVSSHATRDGTRIAFGAAANCVYRFEDADVVVAIDADFLSRGPAAVRYARDFMSRRAGTSESTPNRLYSIESTYTPTGATADHRLPLRPSQIATFMRALAARWQIVDAPAQELDEEQQKWRDAIAADLEQHRGRSIVIVGDDQPADIHALALAINQSLGNVGATVQLVGPNNAAAASAANPGNLNELIQDLNAGTAKLLLVLDSNPVYSAAPSLKFAEALAKAPLAIHWGLYFDETAEACTWHVAAAHYLESWSDSRAYDGTASIVQPLIAPLYGGRTVHEVLSALADPSPRSSYDLVRDTWRPQFGNSFDATWHRALAEGVMADSADQTGAR